MMIGDGIHYCNFCGKNQDYVLVLIAGPDSMICDECVETCSGIVSENKRSKLKEVKK